MNCITIDVPWSIDIEFLIKGTDIKYKNLSSNIGNFITEKELKEHIATKMVIYSL